MLGEADAGPAGHARANVVFRDGVLVGDVVRADGSAVGATVRLGRARWLDGAIQYTNRFAFVAVPPGADHLVALHPLGDHSVTVPGVVLPGCWATPGQRSASG